jgi:hypothetical protein
VEVKKQDLTMTGSMVLQLIQQGLPSHRNNYTVYMDNYFTNIPLFDRLRQLGIGACGTTRPNASKKLFPKALSLLKDSKKSQPWNTLYAAPAGPDSDIDSVLCIAWQDNNIVTALSTVHTVHKSTDWIPRLRKRPAKTSTSAKIAREPFNDQSTKELPIPRLIDEYNSIWAVWIVQINYEQAMRLIKKPYVHGGQYSSGFSMWQLSMLIVLLKSLASSKV